MTVVGSGALLPKVELEAEPVAMVVVMVFIGKVSLV